MTAQTQEARELLQKTQAERDEARSDEELLKVERDKAVQMCAAAVEQRERLKTTYEKLEKRYSREKRGLSSTLDRRKASSSEASDSSSLTDDTGGAADDVHEGCRWKTTSTAQHGGDRRRDTEQVGRDRVHQQKQQQPRSSGGFCLFSGRKGEEPEERARGNGGGTTRTDGGETSLV